MSTVNTSGSTTLFSLPAMNCSGRRQSSFHAKHLLQAVHNVDQIALRRQHRIDVFVRCWQLVDDPGVLAALDARRLLGEVGTREPALGLAARHPAPGAVTARAV